MNWSVYNQSLVRRGEILIGFDIIDNWDTELKQMNKKIKLANHFTILIHFFFYLVMPRYTFIFLIDRLKRELHKAMLNAKSLPFLLHYTINIEE